MSDVWRRRLAALLLSLATQLAAEALAQPHACSTEAAKLCPGVAAAKGALLACLQQHDADLSPKCRKGIERLKKREEAIKRRQPRVSTVRSVPRTVTPAPTAKPTPKA